MWPFGKKNKSVDEQQEQAAVDKQAEKDIAEATNDEDKKKYKRRRLMSKFKLDRHHKMERFMVTFLITITVIFSVGGYGIYDSIATSRQSRQTNSIIMESSKFSLSGVELKVGSFIGNPDKTRVMIPLQASNMQDLSTNAENYQVFVGNGRNISEVPDVKLHVFGSSGLLALEVSSSQPLYNEALSVIIRNNYELASHAELAEDAAVPDDSFRDNDQLLLRVNPGARDVQASNKMNETLTVNDMYYLLEGYEKENEILQSIDALLVEMQDDLLRNEEYMNRIEELGYEAPEAPHFIQNDRIEIEEETINAEGEMIVEDVATDGFYEPRARLYTEHYVAGAYNIKWQGRTTREGFVEQLVDNPADLGRYLRQKEAEQERGTSEISRPDHVTRQDGVELTRTDLTSADATVDEQEVERYLNELTNIWANYLAKKTELQTSKVKELVVLDAEVKTQGQGYSSISIHDDNGEDFVIKLEQAF